MASQVKDIKTYFLFIWLFLFAGIMVGHAQTDVINNIRASIKTGSSRELSKYLNDKVVINIAGDKSSYSKNQAVFVLRDFFNKYPPVGFRYIHQGASKEGLKYVIGTYTYDGGTFRVYMLIKRFNGQFLVDTLDFSKE